MRRPFPVRNDYALPILILLLAAGLRFHALAQNARLHPDEALFSTFARGAALDGEWLLPGALDKPPLTIYSMALAMHFVAAQGAPDNLLDFDPYRGEFAARLPNTLASIVLVATVYALAKVLYHSEFRRARHDGATHASPLLIEAGSAPTVAMLLMALSPFAIAFSATGFSDGLMLMWMALALLAVARDRWLLSGMFLALAIGSKQQGLLYLPLVLWLGWVVHGLSARRILRFALPVVLGLGVLVLWDAARPGTSIWALAAANNHPERLLINPGDLLPRLRAWAGFARVFSGPTAITGGFALIALSAFIWRGGRKRSTTALTVYILSFMLVYTLIPLNTYDRYLLPILPLSIILVASASTRLALYLNERYPLSRRALPLLIAILLVMLTAAIDASEGRIHVGGDLGEHDGIDALADYLNEQALGAIIYDRWLGWELGYYMNQWTDKRRVYYPTPEELAAGALEQRDPAPRYLPAPADQALTPWLDALHRAGFSFRLSYETSDYIVYEIMPPQAQSAG